MAKAVEFADLQWSRKQVFDLADKLDLNNSISFGSPERSDMIISAANALRYMATIAVQDECRQRAPFKPLYRIRNSEGVIIWTCGHNPPHESPV